MFFGRFLTAFLSWGDRILNGLHWTSKRLKKTRDYLKNKKSSEMFLFEAIRPCSSFFPPFSCGTNVHNKTIRWNTLPSSSGKMQLEGEFVPVPIKLYNHLRQAHSLLGKGCRMFASGKCIQLAKKERTPYADSCLDPPWALPCMFRARKKWCVLDRRYATTPVFAASFTDCVSNTFASDMQKGHRQGSKSNRYFISERSLQILCLLSTMAPG